jgi:ethanolamine ammonia-lyase small subunit
MKPPAKLSGSVASRSIEDLRELTPARVGLGMAGATMPTKALLAFTLDHARARDAVHAAFDGSRLTTELACLGLNALEVASQAPGRRDYLRRPDLGRMLDAGSRRSLADRSGDPCELAIVIGDGLSRSRRALAWRWATRSALRSARAWW